MKYIGLLSSAASGKLGGIVASHNRGGTYFRHHSIPVQPRTPSQTTNRAQLAGFSSAFKSLTAAQIAGWNALGSTVTLKSKLGTTYNPTGQQLFVSCNRHLAQINISTVLSTAPTIPSIPAISAFSITAPTPDTTVAAFTAVIAPALPSNFGVVIKATSVQTTGRTFVGKSLFRTLAGYNPASGAPASYFAIFTALFGPLPQSGNITFELKLIDPVSGFAGPEVRAATTFSQPVGTDLFSLVAGSQTGSTSAGSGAVTYTAVEATGIGGFTGAVNYGVTGLPAGAVWSFAVNPKAVGSANTLTVTCTSVATGAHTFNVTATYGSFSVTVSATLTVA
jgi:hypothetical protein